MDIPVAKHWPVAVPILAALLLGLALVAPLGALLGVLCALGLIGAVTAAVHHAEVVAHRIGEPFGTLVLALAVTVIEVALIVSIMLAGGPEAATLARDTLYATVMIIGTGVIGLCVFLGALRHGELEYRTQGAGPALSALAALATLILIMPVFTKSAGYAQYNKAQLAFVAASSFALWLVFVFFQTVRHRDFFLPKKSAAADASEHAAPPTTSRAWASFGLLLVSLVGVVGLAKVLSPTVEASVRSAGLPLAVIGVVIALVVLMPETVAALRAALANRLQTSLNLALGSALATIGLTTPIVVVLCLAFDLPLVLGIEPKDVVLLALTLVIGSIGVGTGRANMMQGAVQLVLFAAFLFLTVVP
ncbi:MAG TPA: ionic transporter y4hA [Burkholderiales bacterium]|nr:ionic transporter y4hA [Betaproteobacteria bacterium]HQR53735.1 ionic transporter y4hA [Burkholderiales bacterium]